MPLTEDWQKVFIEVTFTLTAYMEIINVGNDNYPVLYERINIKANYPLCNQQIVHFLYIRHLQRCVTVNSYEF